MLKIRRNERKINYSENKDCNLVDCIFCGKKILKSIWYAHAAYVILTSDVAAGVLSIIKSCAPVLPRNQWIRPGHLLLHWDKMPWSYPEGRRCYLWELLSFAADSLILGIQWYISQVHQSAQPHSWVSVYKRGWGRSLCLHVVLFSVWKKRKEGWLLMVLHGCHSSAASGHSSIHCSGKATAEFFLLLQEQKTISCPE